MRVEVVAALPEQDRAAFGAFFDAAVERALKNFSVAIATEDSLFTEEHSEILIGGGTTCESVCAGTITVKFREEKLARHRAAHFSLVEKVSELLRQAGSAESLRALISIRGADDSGREPEFALLMRLEAKGSSPEQAGLRWGLGLAHVQQALLFSSRALRQQIGSGAV